MTALITAYEKEMEILGIEKNEAKELMESAINAELPQNIIKDKQGRVQFFQNKEDSLGQVLDSLKLNLKKE